MADAESVAQSYFDRDGVAEIKTPDLEVKYDVDADNIAKMQAQANPVTESLGIRMFHVRPGSPQ